MASPQVFSILSVILPLLLSTTNASSRSLSTSLKTIVLDVASALQQAQDILSIDPTRSSFTNVNSAFVPVYLNSSTPLSLELHSIDTLFPSQHKDYKSLVLSRLERDLSRVAEITAKIRFAVEGVDGFQPGDAITTPVKYRSNEYLTKIGVGTPKMKMYVAFDTGSDVSWIQCKPCIKCFKQSDPIFNPASSSTYKLLPFSSPKCKALDYPKDLNGICQYEVDYNDNSFTKGDFATDTITFGDSGIKDFALGCGHNNQGEFEVVAGLIGLGGRAVSFPKQIKATSFSYCLVERDSTKSSTLDFNSARASDQAVKTPLLRNPKIATFYYIGLTGFKVGGQPVSIPESVFKLDPSGKGGVIVDCGSTFSYLPTQAYNSLRDEFVKQAEKLKLKKVKSTTPQLDTCYSLSKKVLSKVPMVTLQFTGGKSLDLPGKNTLVLVDDSKTFCFAFAPTLTSSDPSIIGNVQQQGTRVVYDLANEFIGFSSNKC